MGVERLVNLTYLDNPFDIRESLAAPYFVDVMKDEGTQQSTCLMGLKERKSTLVYNMKYKFTQAFETYEGNGIGKPRV